MKMCPRRKSTSTSCGLLLCIAFLVELVQGGTVPALYVLGDSQADAGTNNYLVTPARADFPHNGVDYPGHLATGRFSNGYNFVDFLASSLGVATPPTYRSIPNTPGSSSQFLNGVNFASGGAGVSDLTNKGLCISFDEQIELDYYAVYAALVRLLGQAQASNHLAKSIFTVAIGSNDMIERVLLDPTATGLLSISSSQQFVDSLALSLERQLQRMYELGMRKVLFVGAAPLGCCPILRQWSLGSGEECHAEANSLSAKYNVAVDSLLRNMSARLPGFHYSFFNASTALLQYIQEPEANGFAEAKAACCGLGGDNAMFGCSPVSSLCANRTNHIFWDFVHPTEVTAEKLTGVAFDGSAPLVSPVNVRQLCALYSSLYKLSCPELAPSSHELQLLSDQASDREGHQSPISSPLTTVCVRSRFSNGCSCCCCCYCLLGGSYYIVLVGSGGGVARAGDLRARRLPRRRREQQPSADAPQGGLPAQRHRLPGEEGHRPIQQRQELRRLPRRQPWAGVPTAIPRPVEQQRQLRKRRQLRFRWCRSIQRHQQGPMHQLRQANRLLVVSERVPGAEPGPGAGRGAPCQVPLRHHHRQQRHHPLRQVQLRRRGRRQQPAVRGRPDPDAHGPAPAALRPGRAQAGVPGDRPRRLLPVAPGAERRQGLQRRGQRRLRPLQLRRGVAPGGHGGAPPGHALRALRLLRRAAPVHQHARGVRLRRGQGGVLRARRHERQDRVHPAELLLRQQDEPRLLGLLPPYRGHRAEARQHGVRRVGAAHLPHEH